MQLYPMQTQLASAELVFHTHPKVQITSKWFLINLLIFKNITQCGAIHLKPSIYMYSGVSRAVLSGVLRRSYALEQRVGGKGSTTSNTLNIND